MRRKGGKIGRPARALGYSLMIREGELPENRRFLRLYLTEVREGLVEDMSPTGMEKDLSAGQKVMIDRVCNKLAILRCIEEEVREKGVFHGGRLAYVLQESYVCYSNSLRLDLQALGIKPKKAGRVLDLGQYLKVMAKEKGGQGKAKDKDKEEIVPPKQSSSDISGAGDADPGEKQEGSAGPQPGGESIVDPGATCVEVPGQGEGEPQ